jgi:hypothetical protein
MCRITEPQNSEDPHCHAYAGEKKPDAANPSRSSVMLESHEQEKYR